MGMIRKIFNNITYYVQIRDDPVAGKLQRLSDWCTVGTGTASGWSPRPQRFVGTGSVVGDNMVDVTFDRLCVWEDSFGIDKNGTMIHMFGEMPLAYSRTKLGAV